jgi:hypothetical protein
MARRHVDAQRRAEMQDETGQEYSFDAELMQRFRRALAIWLSDVRVASFWERRVSVRM